MTAKKKLSREIWIDLTDMLVWRGHFTGIQRVVYEYATRFSKDGARFCAFDEVDERFFEVSPSILDIDNRDILAQDTMKTPISARRRIRRILGLPYYVLPDKHKKMLRPTVDYANYLARAFMNRITRVQKIDKESAYASMPTADFSKGDTLLLLGAGWNIPSLAQAIKALKEETGLRICLHINDLLPIYQPQLFSDELVSSFKPYVESILNNADIVTVISKATMRDVLTFCKDRGLKIPEMHVVRLGDDIKTVSPRRPIGMKEEEKFILSVGTFEIRKNYILLYQAIKLAQLEDYHLPRIVIAGKKGWLTQDLAHILSRDPYLPDHMLWLEDVSDEELQWLFDKCIFTVFPSLSEGWGLPVAESLRRGKLCLSSGVSSMLEIGNGLVDYFLPYDARECLGKMQYHLAEDRYLEENIHIKKNYRATSWDYSYDQMVKFIR